MINEGVLLCIEERNWQGQNILDGSICDLTEGDIVHNTLVALPTLQLDGSDLHQKRVLIAVELQQVVVQLGGDALLVSLLP